MAAPYRSGQRLGWLPGPVATTTTQLNAAANWFGLSFVPDSGRTLSAVRAFVSAVAGTLGASDITCDLYDSAGTNGAPGSSIETGKVPSSTITASGWYDFTGFTTALTAGQQYWLVFKNVNGTPASNNCTFRYLDSSSMLGQDLFGSSTTRQGWHSVSSTNSGSTWSRKAISTALRVAYADSTYDGLPISNVAIAVVGDGVYSARESGVKFTSPANAILKVAGLAILAGGKAGTPTGAPRLGLWTGSTPSLLAYTADLLTTTIQTTQWVYAYFSSVQTIQPGTVCRVTLAEGTQSDASTNRYVNYDFTWDTDANSLILKPMNGTAKKTYFDGTSTWTDTDGSLFGFALLLDPAGEFGAQAGSGNPFPLIRNFTEEIETFA